MQNPKDVLREISRRARAGQPLNSGANRGDWIYAAAVRHFGSWGVAVEAAGYDYRRIKLVDLAPEIVLERIQGLAAARKPLRSGSSRLLAAAAKRHFGSWAKAVKAAGCKLPSPYRWTKEAVIVKIRDDVAHGLPMNSMAVVRRQETLYQAGRRRFGCWGAALAAARRAGIPVVIRKRQGRPVARVR